MRLIAIALLGAGLALTVLGGLTWRSIGKRLALFGIAVATAAATFLSGNNIILMTAGSILVAALIVANTGTTTRATWRRVRVEMSLAAATILTMVASYALTGVSAGIQNALLVLVGLTAIAFVGSVVFHGIPMLIRDARRELS